MREAKADIEMNVGQAAAVEEEEEVEEVEEDPGLFCRNSPIRKSAFANNATV